MSDATPVATPAPAQQTANSSNGKAPAAPAQQYAEGYGSQPSGDVQGGEQGSPENNTLSEINSLIKKAKLKNKINGKEVSVESLEQLLRAQQQKAGWETKAQELLNMKEESARVRALQDKARKSPNINERRQAARELLGDSFNEIAEVELWEQYQKEKQMEAIPESERKYRAQLEQMQSKLGEYEKEKAERTKHEEGVRNKQVQEHYRKQIDSISVNALSKILDKESAPRVAPMLLPAMAKAMQRQMELGIDVDPNDLANIAYESWSGMTGEFIKKLSPEGLFKFIGPEMVKALNRYQVSLHTQRSAPQPSAPVETKSQVKQGENVWQQLKKQGLLK